MKTKKEEKDLTKFCLSNCLEYEVFIFTNGKDYFAGKIIFEKELNYWKIIFLINENIKNSMKDNPHLNRGDNGFFATIPLTENEVSIRILSECKIMDFFDIEKPPRFAPIL